MPKDGDVRKGGNAQQKRKGTGGTEIYRDPPGEWRKTTGEDAKKAEKTLLEQNNGSLSYTALGSPGTPSTSLRYPEDGSFGAGADYVLFDFYKYQPPFQGINRASTVAGSTPVAAYNQSATDSKFYTKTTEKSIILYMPEDISTGYKANWTGKAFSNIGRDALSTAGSGGVGDALTNGMKTIDTMMEQLIPNTGRKLLQETIGKLTGEQIDDNAIYGSTRGVILNPNVELLFTGHDLRNFSLNYKLVPRNKTEADIIKEIVKVFKRAMLPKFSDGTEFNLVKGKDVATNFIKVPNFCRVSFMRGGGLNKDVPQYKMCSITQVDVNYTPDGTYATYTDGSMVAIGLSLAFQESKLIFSEEADNY
jgi:hypothetical protein